MMAAPNTEVPSPVPHRRLVHILAIVTACAVFPLIFVGAGVTSRDAGMAYPDWPTSAGHLVNPPGWWEADDTRWEHGHRLIGWLVGMLATALAILSWRCGGGLRLMGLATFVAIGVQGVLGGLRVTEISTTLAMVHGIWGQLCFCLVCVFVLMTSRSWVGLGTRREVPFARSLHRLCLAAAVGVLVQLVLGAAFRHFALDAFLVAHLVWAVVVALLIGWLTLWVLGHYPHRDVIETLGWVVALLMVLQLLLGGGALIARVMVGSKSSMAFWLIPSLHAAVGALLLAGCVLMTLSTRRLLQTSVDPLPSSTAAPVPTT